MAERHPRIKNYFLDIWVSPSPHCCFSQLSFLRLWVYALTLKQVLRLTGVPFHNLKEVSQREKEEAISNLWFLFGSQTLSVGTPSNTCTQLGEQGCFYGSLTRWFSNKWTLFFHNIFFTEMSCFMSKQGYIRRDLKLKVLVCYASLQS